MGKYKCPAKIKAITICKRIYYRVFMDVLGKKTRVQVICYKKMEKFLFSGKHRFCCIMRKKKQKRVGYGKLLKCGSYFVIRIMKRAFEKNS